MAVSRNKVTWANLYREWDIVSWPWYTDRGFFQSSHKHFTCAKSNWLASFCNGRQTGKGAVPNWQSSHASSEQHMTCDNIVLKNSTRKGFPQTATDQEILPSSLFTRNYEQTPPEDASIKSWFLGHPLQRKCCHLNPFTSSARQELWLLYSMN